MSDSFGHRYRSSIRLRGYDYSKSEAYFVTICAKDRACLFGEVTDGEMRLNDLGEAIQATWDKLPSNYPGVEIDAFVIMPNHVHGIVVLTDRDDDNDRVVGAQFIAPHIGADGTLTVSATSGIVTESHDVPSEGAMNRAPTLGAVVRGFKARVTAAVNSVRATPGVPVWQRNYYEHIIRDDDDLNRIRQYIIDNPAQWIFDREHPVNAVTDTVDREHPVNAVTDTGVGAQFIAPSENAPSKETWLR